VFQLPLQTSLAYGWITSGVGVVASIVCALLIDKVGRKPWYAAAFLFGAMPLLMLSWLGATSAIEVLILVTIAYAILQTIAFSLYLYSAELYPTRLRAVGTGFGSAWLRDGSSIGPILVGSIVADLGIQHVFAAFVAVAIIGGLAQIRTMPGTCQLATALTSKSEEKACLTISPTRVHRTEAESAFLSRMKCSTGLTSSMYRRSGCPKR